MAQAGPQRQGERAELQRHESEVGEKVIARRRLARRASGASQWGRGADAADVHAEEAGHQGHHEDQDEQRHDRQRSARPRQELQHRERDEREQGRQAERGPDRQQRQQQQREAGEGRVLPVAIEQRAGEADRQGMVRRPVEMRGERRVAESRPPFEPHRQFRPVALIREQAEQIHAAERKHKQQGECQPGSGASWQRQAEQEQCRADDRPEVQGRVGAGDTQRLRHHCGGQEVTDRRAQDVVGAFLLGIGDRPRAEHQVAEDRVAHHPVDRRRQEMAGAAEGAPGEGRGDDQQRRGPAVGESPAQMLPVESPPRRPEQEQREQGGEWPAEPAGEKDQVGQRQIEQRRDRHRIDRRRRVQRIVCKQPGRLRLAGGCQRRPGSRVTTLYCRRQNSPAPSRPPVVA